MESDGFHVRRTRVRVPVHDTDCLPVHAGRPGDRDYLPVHAGRPGDRDCLPVHAGRPDDRDRLPVDHASSATFPFFLTTRYMYRWRASIQQRMRMRMADLYVEGTPQPDLDPEAWVDAVGGPRKGRVYGFGDSLDTTPVLSSYASSVAPPAYASSSAAPPVSGVEEMRTLIREELRTHFGDIIQQLISAMQGVRPSQPAPQ
ncbi:hypothetical protein Taro_012981, partial [Colocasia esculenta]|nr:hypothetical protein [Colocasia esculenta]